MDRIKQLLSGKRAMAWPGMAVVLLLALLSFTPVPVLSPALERLGLMVFDAYQRAAPRAYQDVGVRVIDIDDETIRRYGQWPWPRTDMARLTDALGRGGASAIAFDIVFSEADRTSPALLIKRLGASNPAARAALASLPDNDAVLAASFKRNPVVSSFFLTHEAKRVQAMPKAGMALAGSSPGERVPRFTDAIESLPALSAAALGNGFVSRSGEIDSIVRRAPLIARQGDQLLPALSVDALRVAQGAGSIVIKTSDASGEYGANTSGAADVVALKIGALEVPTTAQGELWLHYTPAVPSRIIPAWKVLTGALSPADYDQFIKGNIVFIGTSAIGLRDLVSTPLSDEELGVVVHAQAAEQIIAQRFLTRPDWAVGLERALLLVLGIGLSLWLPSLGATRGAVLAIAAITVMGAGSWYAFSAQHMLLDPTYPVLGLVMAYTLVTMRTFTAEEKQRAYIHSAFDRYLSPELVRRIADNPGNLELGGEEREMTVLFCDIRSFSSISETMNPKQIIDFLIAFLTPMTDLLMAHKATIDKYIGDAIVAFWNAPLDDLDQYANAARGALQMSARLRRLNAEMPSQTAQPWPGTVRIGIGLNAGPCCVGNMGSQQRLAYSLIGDTVNLASRIEGLTKYYGLEIAIGSALHAHLTAFATLPVDLVRVIGRDAPEVVYVLLGDEVLAADPAFQGFAAQHQAMLAAYRDQAWSKAAKLIAAQGKAADIYGLSKLYEIYAERVQAFAADPPGQDWDGVFLATEK